MKWTLIDDEQLFKQMKNTDLEKIIIDNSINKELVDVEFPYSEELRFFLILTYNSDAFLRTGFTELDIFVNRLFRLKKFYENYAKHINGIDAGIEDQIVSLITEIHSKYPKINWDNLLSD